MKAFFIYIFLKEKRFCPWLFLAQQSWVADSFLEGINSFPAQGTLYAIIDRALPIYFCDVA